MTAPNVYRKAADLIRTGGLAKGTFKIGDSHCIVGAVRVAKHGYIYADRMDEEEIVFLSDLLGGPANAGVTGLSYLRTVARWNDAVERIPEDVIGLLEQAAEKLEADQ